MGLALFQEFSPGHVPIGAGHVFCGLVQTPDILHASGLVGYPEQLRQQVEHASTSVPDGSITVVSSVTGERWPTYPSPMATCHHRTRTPSSRIPAIGRRRLALLQASLPAISHCYGQILKEGLDPGSVSVIVLDPN